MGFFSSLFGKKKKATPKLPPTPDERVKCTFFIVDEGEDIPKNAWFQKSTYKNKRYIYYRGTWSSDWKLVVSDTGERLEVKVAGIQRESRAEDFLKLAFCDNFKMYLEDEPDNPVNKNARKIMTSATIEGTIISKHIGYLPDELANKYAGSELDIRPNYVYLPDDGSFNIGIKVVLLERSSRYLKKQATP